MPHLEPANLRQSTGQWTQKFKTAVSVTKKSNAFRIMPNGTTIYNERYWKTLGNLTAWLKSVCPHMKKPLLHQDYAWMHMHMKKNGRIWCLVSPYWITHHIAPPWCYQIFITFPNSSNPIQETTTCWEIINTMVEMWFWHQDAPVYCDRLMKLR